MVRAKVTYSFRVSVRVRVTFRVMVRVTVRVITKKMISVWKYYSLSSCCFHSSCVFDYLWQFLSINQYYSS